MIGWLKRAVGRMGGARGFKSGGLDRLTLDWIFQSVKSANAELKPSLVTTRTRAREAEQNQDYARRYLSAVENNVLGHQGPTLMMRVVDAVSGKPDGMANRIIEGGWAAWGQRGVPTVDGRLSWREFQRRMGLPLPRRRSKTAARIRRSNRRLCVRRSFPFSFLCSAVNGRRPVESFCLDDAVSSGNVPKTTDNYVKLRSNR